MKRGAILLGSALSLIASLTLASSAAHASTSVAKPHPQPKVSAHTQAKSEAHTEPKASAKVPAKKSVAPSHKPTSHATSKPAPHTTAKTGSVHKTIVHHYYYRPRPRIGIPPSPAPHWPPSGFVSANGVYAKVPSASELVSILSKSKDPSASVDQCAPDPSNPSLQAVACGAILAAATNGCSWWEVNSSLLGPDPSDPSSIITLGTLRTLAGASAAHDVLTIVMVSGVPLGNGMKFTNISAKCWVTPPDETIPSDLFTPAPGVNITLASSPEPTTSSEPITSPTQSDTPTPSPTAGN